MRTLAAFSVLLCACLSMAQSKGQTTSFTKTERGEANITWNGEVDRRSSANLQVYRDGRFRMSFGDRYDHQVSGTYRIVSNREYQLKVDSAFGDSRGSGTGTVDFGPDGRLALVRVSGIAETRKYEIHFVRQGFDVDRPGSGGWGGSGGSGGWGGSGGTLPQDETLRGEGSMLYDGKRDRLNQARITTSRSRGFRIDFSGEAKFTIEGDIRDGSGNNDRLIIREINNADTTGTGEIRRDSQNRAGIITINVRYKGRPLTASIRASFMDSEGGWGSSGGSGGWSGSGGSSEVSSTSKRGRGTVRYRGKTDDLNSASLSLLSGSRFEIRFGGEAKITIEGTWRREDGNNVRMTVTRINNEPSTGRGLARRDNRDELASVSLDTRYRGEALSISFEAMRPR